MKYLLALLFGLAPSMAHADGRPTFEVGYSTWGVVGVVCTTSTVINITTDTYKPTGLSGKFAGYLVQNQDSADNIWLGGPNVNAAAGSGIKVGPGESWAIYLGQEKHADINRAHIYCEADSAAGAAGAQLTVAWFGY